MIRLVPLLLGLALCGKAAAADEPAPAAKGVENAIHRGLDFLAKDAIAWRDKHNCVSCHHAAYIVWTFREAKERGHSIDEPLLAELTKWIAEAGDGKTSQKRPEEAPRAFNPKAVIFALALGTDPQPDDASQAGLKRFFQTIQEDQIEDGSWVTWPETRPPIFGPSNDTATALAALALAPRGGSVDDAALATRAKAVQWLTSTPTDDDPQSLAVRVILWQRLARPIAEVEPLVRRIRERQNADGGWSQSKEMPSDGWATGQTLYALALAGAAPDDPAVRRGQAFLVATQRDDGSWAMTSRPTKPGGPGSKSLIPITGAGSAWAVLGLVRSR